MSEIVNGASGNDTKARVPKNHSRFDLKEVFLDTHRFGEYHPHFVLSAWESDKHPVRSVSDTRSYTLKAPLMQDIIMNKDYFMVNLRSILPFQAERVRTNPTIGDDIPSDAYTSVPDFVRQVVDFANSFDSAIAAENPNGNNNALDFNTLAFKKLFLLESVFSRGSLLASLGCNLSSCVRISNSSSNKDYTIDEVIDNLGSILANDILANGDIMARIDGSVYYVTLPSSLSDAERNINISSSRYTIGIRDFFQKIRDTSDWEFTQLNFGFVLGEYVGTNATVYFNGSAEFPIDLARVWAYHLACAEYFTNDKVDYIYSAELFRQYIYSLISSVFDANGSTIQDSTFGWNGSFLPYDYLSCYYFNALASSSFSIIYGSESSSHPNSIALLQYFLTLFGYHRSLRFKDYFVGSRTRPLALVGNSASGVSTDVPVVNNNVSVIDVTRSIQAQRFLNAVQASGRSFKDWIKSFFDVTPIKDMHEPIFLAHSSDSIFASSNENTGDAVYQDTGGMNTTQNSVTAVFNGRSNRYEYEVDVKEPCIIIGITSYDIERCYPNSIHRDFFIRDRYDMFNPMMQYIGDQSVYSHELTAGLNVPFGTAFGYQFRNMEWKLAYPRCAGAFGSDKLPGYAFIYHADGVSPVVSPDFIRSRNSELDEFYLSLTSYSLGNYFHFIVRQVNLDDSVRPMIAQPQIL